MNWSWRVTLTKVGYASILAKLWRSLATCGMPIHIIITLPWWWIQTPGLNNFCVSGATSYSWVLPSFLLRSCNIDRRSLVRMKLCNWLCSTMQRKIAQLKQLVDNELTIWNIIPWKSHCKIIWEGFAAVVQHPRHLEATLAWPFLSAFLLFWYVPLEGYFQAASHQFWRWQRELLFLLSHALQ